MQKVYDYHLVNTALCVWEWIIEDPEWGKYREELGSLELRYQSIELAHWVTQVYKLCIQNNPDIFDICAYDFEVVPVIMSYASTTTGELTAYISELPSVEEVAKYMIAEYSDARLEVQMLHLNQWSPVWFEDDKALTFSTRTEAEASLQEHLADLRAAVAVGDLEDMPDPSAYRIRPVLGDA